MPHNDYDQYTDQLLNSVFENTKQTSEDQFVNQLLQNLRLSNQTPVVTNQTPVVNNEWLLLQQQLLQQKELLEKLTSNASTNPSNSFQVPVVKEETLVSDQKIPRVPVQPKRDIILEDVGHSNVTATPPPVLEKKKSFLKRALSRNKQFKGKQEHPKPKAIAPVSQSTFVPQNTPAPQIQRRPSFWRPREERQKGWWKGKAGRAATAQEDGIYDDEEYENEYEQEYYDDDEEEEEEEEQVYIPPPQARKKKRQQHQQQRIVTRKAVEPKKVTSIKKQRQMVFKGPSLRKKNKVKNQAAAAAATSTTPASAPVYMMPQQPMYYQQPMMMPQQYMGSNGYYYPSQMGYTQPSYTSTTTSTTEVVKKKPNPSVFNPREAANDKCQIM